MFFYFSRCCNQHPSRWARHWKQVPEIDNTQTTLSLSLPTIKINFMLIVRAAAVQILSMSMRPTKRSDRRTGLDLNVNGSPVLISADPFVRGVGIRDTRSGYTLRLYPASPCKCFLFALCAPHNGWLFAFCVSTGRSWLLCQGLGPWMNGTVLQCGIRISYEIGLSPQLYERQQKAQEDFKMIFCQI